MNRRMWQQLGFSLGLMVLAIPNAIGQLISFAEADERSRSVRNSAFGIVADILGDLDRNAPAPYAARPGQYNVDTSTLAAFSVTIEVNEV